MEAVKTAEYEPGVAKVLSLIEWSQVQDRFGISDREAEVVRQVVGGATNQEIARRLYISESTVKTHLVNIFKKVHARNRAELIITALGVSL